MFAPLLIGGTLGASAPVCLFHHPAHLARVPTTGSGAGARLSANGVALVLRISLAQPAVAQLVNGYGLARAGVVPIYGTAAHPVYGGIEHVRLSHPATYAGRL